MAEGVFLNLLKERGLTDQVQSGTYMYVIEHVCCTF